MSFVLSERSERNLVGVHPDLVRGVRLAITRTPVDFGILDGGGVRSVEQAQANAAAGTGIANSLHIIQPDGYGRAVDLVAFIDGQPSYERWLYDAMMPAIYSAFDELGILVQNGADWDMDGKFGEQGEWDWPHWQLPRPHRMRAAAEAMMRRRGRA